MVALVAASSAAIAQPTAKSYRVGWLDIGTSTSDRSVAEFQQAMRDTGYAEGANFAVVFRYAGGNAERLSGLASELAQLPVDVIVTSGEPAALAAKRATHTIPIVATELALDPVKTGLVASLGRPGGNVTGMSTQNEELWQKRLALLKQIGPKITRVSVLWNPSNPGNVQCAEEIRSAAAATGTEPRFFEVRDAATVDRALAAVTADAADALVTCWDAQTLARAKSIADFARKNRLPTLAPVKEYVEDGLLLSLGTSLPAQRRRAAYYVNRILKGGKPADLPVERPTQFDLVVNLPTAKALGVAIPETMLLLADEVIR